MAQGSVPPNVEPQGVLADGHAAMRRHAWLEAFELLSQADREGSLAAADLEALAEVAFFAARPDVVITARERAFKLRLDAGEPIRAAYVALTIARLLAIEGRGSIASAWVRRAERLLDKEPESYAHGYLALVQGEMAHGRGDIERALALLEQTTEIGDRTGDPELYAWGMNGLGVLQIVSGDAPHGLALMEEASIAAVSGELSPFASGVISCSMISACRDLADYQRATEWIEATDRWCRSQEVSGFPGICRLHRAEVLAASGGWERAEQELERATDELAHYNATPPRADGFYALGEIRRLRGDLDGAESAYRQAHALGRTPQPGLALVRLAEGKVAAAAKAIAAAMDEAAGDRWTRARLAGAQVQIAIAAGDVDRARAATDELAETVATYPSPTMQATVHASLGRVLLAEGNAAGAVRESRTAIRTWREVPSPHEAARARMVLADALRALGDDDAAVMELETARAEFERLGAKLDKAAAVAAIEATAGRGQAHTQVRMTFMFTDIVGSTKLAEALGDESWQPLLEWHDRTLRSLVERSGGRVVKSTGDGVFAAFDSARRAVESAVAIQRALAEHRRTAGFALGVRIGLHAAEAVQRGDDYTGMGVHVAARVAAQAAAGEILATAETLAEAGAVEATDPREVELKGISSPVAIATIAWS